MVSSYLPDYRDGQPPVRPEAGREGARHPGKGGKAPRWTIAAAVVAASVMGILLANSLMGGLLNRKPEARIAADRTVLFAGGAVIFDASGSADPEGGPLEYCWDFGDGSAPLTIREPRALHTYAGAGGFRAYLTVRDARGAASTAASSLIWVVPRPAASAGSVWTYEEVNFSAASPELQDAPLRFSWTFSDGAPPAEGAEVRRLFRENGTFAIALNVSSGGCSATSELSISVLNRKPAPALNLTEPEPIYANHETRFDGSGSSDRDGSIVRWGWDFGDGMFDDAGGPEARHRYCRQGVFNATLTVTDNDGASGSASRQITVLKDLVITGLNSSIYIDQANFTRANVTVWFANPGDPKPAGSVLVAVTAYKADKISYASADSRKTAIFDEPALGGASRLSVMLVGLGVDPAQPEETWYLVELAFQGTAMDSGWYRE